MYKTYEDAMSELDRLRKDPDVIRQLAGLISPGGGDKARQKAQRLLQDIEHRLLWKKRTFEEAKIPITAT